MTKELIIHSSGGEIHIALLENGRLVELNQDRGGSGFSVGDIYVGRVRKIMAGLNAAFVNVGYEKDAFIHYHDLGANFNNYQKLSKQTGKKGKTIDISYEKKLPDLKKDGRIGNQLSTGDSVLVQIAKEPISTKGPRLTGDISIPGRHLVLIPFSSKIHISQKVKSAEERKRLRKIVEKMLPKNFGTIVRTAAENKTTEDIENDIADLLDKWSTVMATLPTVQAPSRLLGEENRTTAILRDLLNDSFSAIHTDNETVYNQVRDYISEIEPDAEKIVKLYRGNVPIFDNFDVTKQIKQNFGKTVPFKRGAYLIVEHTEALHVIDVNSGRRSNSDENQEQNALEVNLNAVPEVARQLRLKDMGGIIVIDFIDLHQSQNRSLVLKAMEQAMSLDRAKHTILPLTKFGLMQITRQRVRPETQISINETCPTCRGTGQVSPTILLDQQLENQIAYYSKEKHLKIIRLHLHPYVASYLTKGLFSLRFRWAMKYMISLKVIPNDSLGMIDFKFYNSIGDELN
ncbi:MAG: Rne/Rng family ribonuclease [Rikenellaceae bacterium]